MFYDPLGMISSITLHFTLMFHSTCLNKYDRDTLIEPTHIEAWSKIIQGLKLLKSLRSSSCTSHMWKQRD